MRVSRRIAGGERRFGRVVNLLGLLGFALLRLPRVFVGAAGRLSMAGRDLSRFDDVLESMEVLVYFLLGFFTEKLRDCDAQRTGGRIVLQ